MHINAKISYMKKSINLSLIIVSAIAFVLTVVYAIIGIGPIILAFISFALILSVGVFLAIKNTRGKKVYKRVVYLILSIVTFLVGIGSALFGHFHGNTQTIDYINRVEIWGESVPYNSTDSKLKKMNIDYHARMLGATIGFSQNLNKHYYVDAERVMDTLTYSSSIRTGIEKTTFEDRPYLIPYLVSGSDSAVIIVCGGGFVNKSINGSTHEGVAVAKELNKKGISAFVLWYRSNPYEYPVPQIDFMRAVKYLRFNASTYGFNPENISAIGFSAGAFVVASYINLADELYPLDYQKDQIDLTSGEIQTAGLNYPVLTYKYNVPMLFCSFDAKSVKNEQERKALLEKTDLSKHVNSEEVNQFISYGTADTFVNFEGAKEYIKSAKEKNINLQVKVLEGQRHAFNKALCLPEFIEFLNINKKS